MPFLCCVPKCNGNYPNGPKVSLFGFPKDPVLREKWIHAIKREHFTPNNNSKVCELHFQQDCIETKTTFRNETTGEVLEAPLKNPRLIVGAVPSKLPGCPSYLSKPDIQVRDSPATKRLKIECENIERAVAESLKTSENYNEMISFSTINEAFKKMDKLEEGWVKVQGAKHLCFFYLNESSEHQNLNKLAVYLSNDLMVKVFFAEHEVKKLVCVDKSVFQFPVKVSDTNFLHCVLSESKTFLIDSLGQKCADQQDNTIKLVCDILNTVSEQWPEKKDCVKFLQEQINLLTTSSDNRLRYSCETSLFACLLYTISPHAYKFLRSLGKITLPSPRTIKTICASFNTDPRVEQNDSDFLKYAANKFNLLDDNDKTIILMLDEIHVKPNIDYKSGNIVGEAFNDPGKSATSAHVFMINSLRSDYKDVVHVLPVRKITGEELHKITKKVILGLEEIGFEVLVVVTDNNALNKKAMSYFAECPHVSNEYVHPCDPNRPLFYIIDPVHILKNIRNNWINKKGDQLFKFPDFDSDECSLKIASFHALKDMHTKEKGQLLKYGYSLTLKALYPSSMERQNVKLVLQVFNQNTVTALEKLGPKLCLPYFEDTSNFINIICKWWDIINVKTPLMGQRLRNKFQEPVTANSDHIYQYLKSFLGWLDRWKSFTQDGGLTKETHEALYQSTSGLLKLSEYCINKKNYNYVLFGQVQTDKLEERFGKYRYQAGSQYHVYARQVFETESKLRMNSVISLIIKSKNYGEIPITKEDISSFCNYQVDDASFENVNISQNLKKCGVVTEDDLNNIRDNEWPPLVYVAGYSAYSVLKKIKCDYCKTFLTCQDELDDNSFYSLISATSRGGLCFPSDTVIKTASYAYIITQKLLNNEDDFLRQNSQQQILSYLTVNSVSNNDNDIFLGHSGICHNENYLIKLLVRPMTNILLKNYVKKRNDILSFRKSMPEVKR